MHLLPAADRGGAPRPEQGRPGQHTTRIVDATAPGGFDFLGWHFERGLKWPREKSLAHFKEVLREETPRNSGQSLETIIGRVNRRIRGWARYFQGGVKNVYERLDQWLRGRLRSILRGRAERKGRAEGWTLDAIPTRTSQRTG